MCTLVGCVCRKNVMLELKRHRGVALCKMTYVFKNHISNLVNLHATQVVESNVR